MLLIAKCTSAAVALGVHAVDDTPAQCIEVRHAVDGTLDMLVRPYKHVGVNVTPRVHACCMVTAPRRHDA